MSLWRRKKKQKAAEPQVSFCIKYRLSNVKKGTIRKRDATKDGGFMASVKALLLTLSSGSS